jgi:hypothetical protein
MWHEHSKEWFSTVEDFEKETTGVPRKDCDSCYGRGTYRTTYNPDSKWDWYVVGGRWNGMVRQKPRDDDEGGGNYGDEFHDVGENSTTVKNLIEAKEIPFALLDPEGNWIEKGEMGWWGCVSNETEKNEWEDQVMRVYEKFKDYYAVGLDCHI